MTADLSKVVMISGANRGIGRALAKRLYQVGYQLSLGARDLQTLDWAQAWDSEQVFIHAYDAQDKALAKEWVANTVARFGRLDALINNAGILRSVSLEDGDEADLDLMWQVNVKGPWLLTRAAFPHLKACGQGRVIHVASLSGKRVKGKYGGYAMSKHALMALSHATRQEGWEYGVRTTALCPGWVNTEMASGSPLAPEEMIQPEDLGELVVSLLRLSNTASVAELWINCSPEHQY